MSNEREHHRDHGSGSSANHWLVIALACLTAVLGVQVWNQNHAVPPPADWSPRKITPKGDLASSERTTIEIFERTSPSVVFIRTKGFQPYLFGGGQEQELSSGTGFVWDKQGYVVTNLHVVESSLASNNTAMEVQFADKSVVDAELIGGVREHDIAILKVSASADQLQPIPLGTSEDLEVGQQVLAIGNPFGFDRTLSTGVIGGLNRSVAAERGGSFLSGLIQTDAAINPGNSGGPLLDSSGRMIGVNTAIVSPTGAYSGLGFAVPVSSVVASVEMVLQQTAGNRKPILGITVLSREQAELLGVPAEISERGLFIKQIEPGGPASKSELRPTQQLGYRIVLGDQIAAVDDVAVTTIEELQAALARNQPGDVVTIHIYRGRQRGQVQVTLEAQKLLFD